ncbi:DotU family type IV/VI secretion system protein [Tautonia marina]|uniref:DotU family type IV/VI secretion system protein n=1 Tax=Tautonia marina TaxID=2653855 RepID=UPI0012604A46|nr:DotU family type IV/VI secretion system protein [Tautonia marina]
MTDAFADLIHPYFEHVIALQDRLAWGESPSIDVVKTELLGYLDKIENRAATSPQLSQDFAMVKYGLVAWTDEVLTDSEWGQSVDWGAQEQILEWDLYRSNLRAEKFYDMAAQAERRGTPDTIEVYLLCVALGFRGRMALLDEDQLLHWVSQLYERVLQASPVSSKPVFPEMPPDANPRSIGTLRGAGLLVTISSLVAISALITLAFYILSVHLDYAR